MTILSGLRLRACLGLLVGTAPTLDAGLASLWTAAACLLVVTRAAGSGTCAHRRLLFAAVLLPVPLRLEEAADAWTGKELRPLPMDLKADAGGAAC